MTAKKKTKSKPATKPAPNAATPPRASEIMVGNKTLNDFLVEFRKGVLQNVADIMRAQQENAQDRVACAQAEQPKRQITAREALGHVVSLAEAKFVAARSDVFVYKEALTKAEAQLNEARQEYKNATDAFNAFTFGKKLVDVIA